MKKVFAALIVALSAGGVAWADDEGTGWGYIEDYYESIPKGNPATLMMLKAWGCRRDMFYIMMGADLNERGAPYDDAVESIGFDEEERALVKEGFKYSDPFDSKISQNFAKCLVDAHKNIGK